MHELHYSTATHVKRNSPSVIHLQSGNSLTLASVALLEVEITFIFIEFLLFLYLLFSLYGNLNKIDRFYFVVPTYFQTDPCRLDRAKELTTTANVPL